MQSSKQVDLVTNNIKQVPLNDSQGKILYEGLCYKALTYDFELKSFNKSYFN